MEVANIIGISHARAGGQIYVELEEAGLLPWLERPGKLSCEIQGVPKRPRKTRRQTHPGKTPGKPALEKS